MSQVYKMLDPVTKDWKDLYIGDSNKQTKDGTEGIVTDRLLS